MVSVDVAFGRRINHDHIQISRDGHGSLVFPAASDGNRVEIVYNNLKQKK
jgi:hypothetical protein